MAFAQLTYRESLRDIESCLRAAGPKLYHMGIRGRVSRSTLADANEQHEWRIYADFAQILIAIARKRLPLDQSLYTILQVLSVTIFEKTPIWQAFCDSDYSSENTAICNQLTLLDL